MIHPLHCCTSWHSSIEEESQVFLQTGWKDEGIGRHFFFWDFFLKKATFSYVYDTLTLYISFVLGLWFWNFSNGCWLSCQTMSSEVITTVPSMAAATFLGKRLSHDTSVDERQLHSYSMRNPMFLAQVASDWYGQWKWYSATAATPGFTGCCILWLFGCVLEWMVLKWIHVPGMKWHTLWLRLWWGLIIQSASEQKQLPHWTGWKSNQNGTEDS